MLIYDVWGFVVLVDVAIFLAFCLFLAPLFLILLCIFPIAPQIYPLPLIYVEYSTYLRPSLTWWLTNVDL